MVANLSDVSTFVGCGELLVAHTYRLGRRGVARHLMLCFGAKVMSPLIMITPIS